MNKQAVFYLTLKLIHLLIESYWYLKPCYWLVEIIPLKSIVWSKFRKLLSDPSSICGVLQGSILVFLPFLIYVNDMAQAVKSNLFLYADDYCLVFQGKNVIEVERQLNRFYKHLCLLLAKKRLNLYFLLLNVK